MGCIYDLKKATLSYCVSAEILPFHIIICVQIYLQPSQELHLVTITSSEDLPLVVPNLAVVIKAKKLQELGAYDSNIF